MLEQLSEALAAPDSTGGAPVALRRPTARWFYAASPCLLALLLVGSPIAARGLGGDWPVGVSLWFAAVAVWFAAEWREARDVERPGSFAVVAAMMGASFFSVAWIAQPFTTEHHGLAWDGMSYWRMFNAFNGIALGPVTAPFGQRIGLPLFATFLPGRPVVAFLTLAMLSWVAGLAALGYTLRAHFRLSGPWIVATVAWACIFYASPDRYGIFGPFSVDAPAFAILCGFLALARSRRLTSGGQVAFGVIAGLFGALFKETALMWATFGFVGHAWVVFRASATSDDSDAGAQAGALRRGSVRLAASVVDRRTRPWLGLTLGAAAGLALAQIPFGASAGVSNAHALIYWLHWRLEHPLDFVRIVVAWTLALAPFLALAFSQLWLRMAHKWPSVADVELAEASKGSETAHVPGLIGVDRGLWIALGLWVFVSAFSGLDLTRFAFSALPLAAPLIIRAVSETRASIAALSFALTLPIARPWSVVPSPTVALDAPPMGWKLDGLTSWFAEYAHPVWLLAWMIGAMAAGALIAWRRTRSDCDPT
ncbi:hypothetical protein LA345_12850 [Burkholderia vietnamiensis]|uniref:Glycosyltransferase RgtA/B/C/D-like domain-containing protein n=1 Tax=Burkholderia vietnamiensis (strain G4 / LMG 22486) TaxID=269482 RepID=A4JFI7_BURVG|nr:hypothetical protein Bcep1808_2038 [Burkholderia vietnamiensis G4]MCB4344800.1 hypothetical protein [Burkholderia vietnamiensis]